MKNNEVRKTQLEIFEEFKKLKTGEDKAKYCEQMDGTTEYLNINWVALAKSWRNNDWPKPIVEEEDDDDTKKINVKGPKKEKKKENAWIQSYVDPVGQTNQEKVLTREELDALL